MSGRRRGCDAQQSERQSSCTQVSRLRIPLRTPQRSPPALCPSLPTPSPVGKPPAELSCSGAEAGKLWGRRVPGSGCGVGGCGMVSGTGSSLMPGPGEKAGPDGCTFKAGTGGGGDSSGGAALGPPRRPSSGQLMGACGGEEPSGEWASGRSGSGSAPAAPPPA